jgi:RimJ/RimL family protein N-acetyltransferase
VLFHQEISSADEEVLTVLHQWDELETNREMYTCRPVTPLKSLRQYIETTKSRLEQRTIRIFVFVSDIENIPYGKVTAFDYNPRNHSAEFGYYLPEASRGKGYGRNMVQTFLNVMFRDSEWELHKLYATTASGNVPSTTLLKRLGFHLDGIIRDAVKQARQAAASPV